METEIKRVYKNYYKIYQEPICSVFMDEYLMKKANKILCKYRDEIISLFKNNEEHLISEKWALAYPNGEQEPFHGTDLKKPKNYRIPIFITEKVDDLFYIGDRNIYSDEVKNAVTKILEEEKCQ